MPTDLNFPSPPASPPPPPPPKTGGGWKWFVGGCLGLLAVGTILVVMSAKALLRDPGLQKTLTNAQSAPERSEKLQDIKNALERYRQSNGGAFPNTLEDLVKAKSLTESELVFDPAAHVKYLYTKPAENAPADAVVVSTPGDKTSMFGVVEQITYYRLLKDGRVVQDQLSRTDLNKRGR